jgi:DNA-binding response OmpR family regulator
METNKYGIFCFEDDDNSCEMLELLLKRSGLAHSFKAVHTSRDALRLISDEAFDLYIVDLWLRDMSGFELINTIRELNERVPIMVYSAVGRPSDRQRAIRAGADDVLVKPDDLVHIIPTAERLLKASRPPAAGTHH